MDSAGCDAACGTVMQYGMQYTARQNTPTLSLAHKSKSNNEHDSLGEYCCLQCFDWKALLEKKMTIIISLWFEEKNVSFSLMPQS